MVTRKKTTRIFLIRGLARETRHWGGFLPRMAQSFSGAKIHPLEIPGSGRLNNHISPIKSSEYINAIRQQYLNHAAEGDDCKIIGLSLGGMIVAHWLEQNPLDFSAAVLINTSLSISPFYKRLQISGGAQLFTSLLTTDIYKREKKLASLLCNLANRDVIARQWVDISKTAPVTSKNLFRQLIAAATFRLPAKPKVPMLILCSTNDRLVSASCSKDIASLWNSILFCHDTAGHDITTDDPEWCIKKLQNWAHFNLSGD